MKKTKITQVNYRGIKQIFGWSCELNKVYNSSKILKWDKEHGGKIMQVYS